MSIEAQDTEGNVVKVRGSGEAETPQEEVHKIINSFDKIFELFDAIEARDFAVTWDDVEEVRNLLVKSISPGTHCVVVTEAGKLIDPDPSDSLVSKFAKGISMRFC